MKITATQLRKIIKEEVVRVLTEGRVDPKTKDALDQFVKDCTYNAGFTGPDYPPKPRLGRLNMAELMSHRYLGRRPTPEDLEALDVAWEEGRKKWGHI